MRDGIEIYDMKEIEAYRFEGTKKITKRKIEELIGKQFHTNIKKIKSSEDLQQLIEEL